jgi:LemA protein
MIAVWVVLGLIVLLVLTGILMYNRLVRARVRVDNGWSQIDVQLKRRYDLIPNLIETVKGYAAHEREVFEAVTNARAQAQNASGVQGQAEAENQLTQSIRQLFAVAENYPELKASQNFLALQEELTSTENKITFARQAYNDAATTYNTRIETFPSNIIAGNFGFKPEPLFQVSDEKERQAPQVKF